MARNNLFSINQEIKLVDNLNSNNKEIYFTRNNEIISPWHDIQYLNEDNTINMICEIPRYTRKKFEINTKLKNNPILQDTINGKPREYLYGDMLFNYGAIPQTWENPNILCESTLKYGDDDPLDVIDIGDYQAIVGLVYKVKVIGILALIDGGETDWKVIAININDPNSENINSLDDVEHYKPGCLGAVKHWFENYKTVRGKAKNIFAFDGKYKGMEYTKNIINKCHLMWKISFIKDISSSTMI